MGRTRRVDRRKSDFNFEKAFLNSIIVHSVLYRKRIFYFYSLLYKPIYLSRKKKKIEKNSFDIMHWSEKTPTAYEYYYVSVCHRPSKTEREEFKNEFSKLKFYDLLQCSRCTWLPRSLVYKRAVKKTVRSQLSANGGVREKPSRRSAGSKVARKLSSSVIY